MRKNVGMTLCAVTLMLSSCVVGPDSFALVPAPTPYPYPEYPRYVEVLKEFFSPRVQWELFDSTDFRTVTVISIGELIADSWLLGWAFEATLNDWPELTDEIGPGEDYLPVLVWFYANGFGASELRCVEGRPELVELIKTFAGNVREKRPDTFFPQVVVANTLWKQLPEGEANCTAYLTSLPAEEFMAIVVNDEFQFGVSEEDR